MGAACQARGAAKRVAARAAGDERPSPTCCSSSTTSTDCIWAYNAICTQPPHQVPELLQQHPKPVWPPTKCPVGVTHGSDSEHLRVRRRRVTGQVGVTVARRHHHDDAFGNSTADGVAHRVIGAGAAAGDA